MGAYSLLFQCPVLLLDSTEESYVRTHHTFPLRSLLLPILTEDSMHSVVNSLPHLEELSKENQRLTWSPGHLGTSLCNLHDSRRIVLTRHLSRVTSLKVGGLYHPSILNGLHAIIGTLPGQFPVFDEQRQAPDSHIHIQQAGRPQQFSDKQLQGRLATGQLPTSSRASPEAPSVPQLVQPCSEH